MFCGLRSCFVTSNRKHVQKRLAKRRITAVVLPLRKAIRHSLGGLVDIYTASHFPREKNMRIFTFSFESISSFAKNVVIFFVMVSLRFPRGKRSQTTSSRPRKERLDKTDGSRPRERESQIWRVPFCRNIPWSKWDKLLFFCFPDEILLAKFEGFLPQHSCRRFLWIKGKESVWFLTSFMERKVPSVAYEREIALLKMDSGAIKTWRRFSEYFDMGKFLSDRSCQRRKGGHGP